MAPLKELLLRNNCLRLVRFPIADGMAPLKLLALRLNP